MTPLELACRLAREAGARILQIRDRGAAASRKTDGSPVTEADLAAETIILRGLHDAMASGVLPDQPIIAEEAVSGGDVPAMGDRFILVDPLDGTREFVAGRDEFTVNIAFVNAGVPVAGVVYAPATGTLYAGDEAGAFSEQGERREPLDGGAVERERPCIVASRSHRDARTDAWIAAFSADGGCDTVAVGSSLKFGLLAEGRADHYPRFSRTMLWDIAAGDAVLRAAGGMTFTTDGRPLRYGEPGGARDAADTFATPDFIASRKNDFPGSTS